MLDKKQKHSALQN